MLKNVTRIPFIILLLLAGYASFGAILPSPALPAISSYFHASASQTAAVISIYLVGYAIGQLIYGPLSNRFGRKTPLMVGVWIAFIGSVMCVVVPYMHIFTLFLIARFITAIGAAASLVITMILIKDCYDDVNARRTFSLVVLTFAFVPFIASSLGGLLTRYLGWQSLSAVMILYAVILLFLVNRLPETLSIEKRSPLSIKSLLISYKDLCKNKEYLRLILLYSLGSAASYMFNVLAPILTIKTIGITPQVYGWLSVIPSIGILIGGFTSTRFAHFVKASTFIMVGVSFIAVGGLGLTVLFAIGAPTLISLYMMAIIIFIGHALVIPNAGMQAQAQIIDHANGTSIMNASALAFSSLLVSLGGGFIHHAPLFALPIAILGIGLMGMILSLRGATQAIRVLVKA